MDELAGQIEREMRERMEGSEQARRESREQAQRALELQNADELAKRGLKPRRITLSRRKEDLISFLGAHGSSTRQEIIEATSIPPGSLSELLKGHEFEQVTRGLWRLRMPKQKK
jgi:hypothetical protein